MKKFGFRGVTKFLINIHTREKKWYKDIRTLLNLGAFIVVIVSIWISQCHHNEIMISAEKQIQAANQQFEVNTNILKEVKKQDSIITQKLIELSEREQKLYYRPHFEFSGLGGNVLFYTNYGYDAEITKIENVNNSEINVISFDKNILKGCDFRIKYVKKNKKNDDPFCHFVIYFKDMLDNKYSQEFIGPLSNISTRLPKEIY